MDTNTHPVAPHLTTTAGLVDELPWLTMERLRYWLRHADQNGLSIALIRPGRRSILVDREAFNQWLEERRQGGAAA